MDNNQLLKDEIIWVHYRDENGNDRYIITSDKHRVSYFLYEIKDGAPVRIAEDETPEDFEDYMDFGFEDDLKGENEDEI